MMDQETLERDSSLEELEATTERPGTDAPPAKGPRKSYQIDIFLDWCKSCGICAAFCPKQCIRVDEEGGPVVESSERCTGCRWCELHCPDFAISVRECQEKVAREEAD
jgi:2-oxoglutarate ferredoxin oxidoreductase subunit delta